MFAGTRRSQLAGQRGQMAPGPSIVGWRLSFTLIPRGHLTGRAGPCRMTASDDTEVTTRRWGWGPKATCQARLSEWLLGPAWDHAGHQSPPHPPQGLCFTWSGLRLEQLPFWGAGLRTTAVRRSRPGGSRGAGWGARSVLLMINCRMKEK